ncbi:MAG: DUF167 domain-containing protein [Candidatus Hydrogenedentes bacterium]|nr:DUF167 domain-containing protein [Candidatus Hydrogenedentota bacterium]
MERNVLNRPPRGPGASETSCRIDVRVQPKASRNACTVDATGRIRVALTAPPVDGAANAALVDFVAEKLGLPKRAVHLGAGEKSRDKTIAVHGIDRDTALARLRGAK